MPYKPNIPKNISIYTEFGRALDGDGKTRRYSIGTSPIYHTMYVFLCISCITKKKNIQNI